jgi:hypothetical protein
MAKNPFAAYNKKKDDEEYAGKETMGEEMLEHGVVLEKPLKAHKGEETPEEEAAEEREIEELTGKPADGDGITPKMFADEVRALLAKLDAPPPPRPKYMSLDEKKLPL